MAGTKTAAFYLQLEAVRPSYGRPDENGELPITAVKAVRITQARPSRPISGSIIVKLEVEIPVSAFAPLRPEARIVIPEPYVETVPVEVVAVDPAEVKYPPEEDQ